MFPKSRWLVSLIVVGTFLGVGYTSSAIAQGGGSGFAQRELDRFRRQALGRDTSVDEIIRRDTRSGANVPYVGQSTRPTNVGRSLTSPGALSGRPFANFTPSPTVSPYLNLFREDVGGNSDLNYHTLVRPMLQQQQFNQQVQRQELDTQRRLQAIAAQSNFNPRGSQQQFPTGHPTAFMYYSRFYPGLSRR